MYYSLPVKERIELMKKYKTAYPGMSYNEMVEHFNTVQEYGNGGKVNTLEGDIISNVLINRNKDKDFVQRAYAVGQYPNSNMFQGNDPEEFGNKMSHKMAWGEDDKGQTYIFPTIYNDKNEAIKVPNQYVDYISSEGYKKATGMIQYSKGGLIEDGDKELTPQQKYAPTPTLNMTPQMQQMAFTPTTQKEVGDWVKKHGRGNVDESVNPIDFIIGGEAAAIAKAINPRYLRAAKTVDKIGKAGTMYEAGETAYNVSKYKPSFKPMVGEINNMHKRPDIDISDVAEKVRDNYVKTKNTGKIKYDYRVHNPIPNTTQEDILRSYGLTNYNNPVIKQNLGWKPLNK